MKPVAFGCQDDAHQHEIIVRSFPVTPEAEGRRRRRRDDPPAVGLLTIWRCRTLHRVGGFWHDLRTPPDNQHAGGPLR